ncbi:carbonyl reductase [NADPH] 1-like [Littorina saxatilis]|uniref:carbonyl reductase (NADPH) n=1 Tax=Littorina saxatilis TaxID=31220 RepID=A0AAN9BJP1_9CAEN
MARATKVAVVTGGNKGIGLEVVRGLCRKFDGDVILTARDEAKGHAAVERLVRESEVEPLFRQLDISNHGSIHRLSNFLLDTYGGLDILVNNAGVMYPMGRGEVEALSTQVRDTMRVNFWGCLDCCKVLFPHLRPGARVVNVTSMYCRSTLRECSPPLRAQLTDPHITMAQLEKLMTDFQRCADAGTNLVNGWPTFAYGVSKIGVTAMTQIQQQEMDQSGHKDDILINACCPGWCRTDIGGHGASKSAAQGADTPVYLSLLPPGTRSPRGALLSDRTIQKWG